MPTIYLYMLGSMCLIQLPKIISKAVANNNKVTYEQAELIQNVLYHDFKIEVRYIPYIIIQDYG